MRVKESHSTIRYGGWSVCLPVHSSSCYMRVSICLQSGLSVHPVACLFSCPSLCPSMHPSICLSIHPPVLPAHISVGLSYGLPICPFISLSDHQADLCSICPTVCLSGLHRGLLLAITGDCRCLVLLLFFSSLVLFCIYFYLVTVVVKVILVIFHVSSPMLCSNIQENKLYLTY